MDSFTCNFDHHFVTRRDESNISAVELAVVHHELAVDSLLRFVDFAMENYWRPSGAVHAAVAGSDPNLVHLWHE